MGQEQEGHGTAAVAAVIGVAAEEPERSYVLGRSVGSDAAEVGLGIAGIGTEVGGGTVAAGVVGQEWTVQSSGRNFVEDGEVVEGTAAEPRMEQQLGTNAAAGTADVADRTDQLCVD